MLKVVAVDTNGTQYAFPNEADIPTYISTWRKERGLSMQELATQLGVARQTVWLWENGTSVPTTENLTRIVEVFNCEEQAAVSVPDTTDTAGAVDTTPEGTTDVPAADRAAAALGLGS